MRSAIILGGVLAVVWCLWSGYFVPLLLSLGALSVLLVLVVCSRLGTVDDEGVAWQLLPGLLGYLPWYLKEIVVSNLAVAKVVLDPRLPISPTVIDAPTSQRTDLGRVIYANSITLTPGTVSFDLRPGIVRVHALTREMADGVLAGEMDRRVARIEGRA